MDAGFQGRKQQIREHPPLPDGELAWQQLQGQVYGAGIAGAALFDGVDGFLRRCAASMAITVFIVSHKTEFGHYDPDARQSAPRRARLDADARFLLRPVTSAIAAGARLSSRTTRAEKLDRIARLGCTHFIDDLEEVLDRSRISRRA